MDINYQELYNEFENISDIQIISKTNTYLIYKTGHIYVANFYGYTDGNKGLINSSFMPDINSTETFRSIMWDDTNKRCVHCYLNGGAFIFYDSNIGTWSTGNIFGQIIWCK